MNSILAAAVRDAPRLVPLMRDRGYEVTADLLAARLRALTTSASDSIMVATVGDALIGCIGCHVLELLHVPGRLGRITTSVVASSHQRQGIGAHLAAAADAFFRAAGCVRVALTSSPHGVDAHAFYTSLGFSESRKRLIESL